MVCSACVWRFFHVNPTPKRVPFRAFERLRPPRGAVVDRSDEVSPLKGGSAICPSAREKKREGEACEIECKMVTGQSPRRSGSPPRGWRTCEVVSESWGVSHGVRAMGQKVGPVVIRRGAFVHDTCAFTSSKFHTEPCTFKSRIKKGRERPTKKRETKKR